MRPTSSSGRSNQRLSARWPIGVLVRSTVSTRSSRPRLRRVVGIEDHSQAGIVGAEGNHLLRRVAAAQRGEVMDQSPRGPRQRGPPIQPVPLEPRDAEMTLQRLLPSRRLERPARRRADGRPHLRQLLRRGPLRNHDLTRRPPLQLGRQLLLGDLGAGKFPGRSLDNRYACQRHP